MLPMDFNTSEASISSIHALTYTTHSFIHVDSDVELSNVASSGTGTEIDPFIIEGWNITTVGAVHAIHIQNITANLTIRNCWINTDSYTGTHGIFIENTSDCSIIIENNICSYNDYGIYLNDLNGVAVELYNNTCFDNTYGIYVDFAIGEDVNVIENICFQNDVGIKCNLILYPNILGNNCTANVYGIYLEQALGTKEINYNHLSENTEIGLYIHTSSSQITYTTNISHNFVSFSDVGISINNSDEFAALNNTVLNSGTTGYLIDNADYWGMTNNTIKYSNGNGITIIGDEGNVFDYSSHNFDINFTEISYCAGTAIHLMHCDWNHINNNTIKFNGQYGIYMGGESQHNSFYHNLFFKNQGYGVVMNETEDLNSYIYLNDFILNNQGGVQGWADRNYAVWYLSGLNQGNYWSDWSGVGLYYVDGVSNGDPYPLVYYDFDGDALPDGWEGFNGLDPSNPDDRQLDLDDDGVLNYEEYNLGLNASNSDTDYDRLPDRWELDMNLDPLNASDMLLDKDGDFLTNLQEYIYGTNATDEDTDHDGVMDVIEILAGTDATDPLDFPENITVIVTETVTSIVPVTSNVVMTSWVTKQTADFVSLSLIGLALIGLYLRRRR